jgi:hypothetical protein
VEEGIWERTGTINKYTGKPNWIYIFEDGRHCLVYRRQYSWAYTTRIHVAGNRWIQLSSNTDHGFNSATEAKEECLLSMQELYAKIGSIVVVRKAARKQKFTDDELSTIFGLSREAVDNVWDDGTDD